MVIDRAKTVRGAVAGAVAAGVWAAQQPLDKPRLRRRLRRHRAARQGDHARAARGRSSAWRCTSPTAPLLGAVYAGVAPRMPVPSWSRGPIVALGRAPRDVAADGRRRPRPSRARRPAAARRQLARVRAGDVAPPAVRRRAGRARAAPERPAGPRAAALRARRVEQRPRPARARRHRDLTRAGAAPGRHSHDRRAARHVPRASPRHFAIAQRRRKRERRPAATATCAPRP